MLRGRFAATAVCALFDAKEPVDECARLLRCADERRPGAPSLRGAALVRACGKAGREGRARCLAWGRTSTTPTRRGGRRS